MGSEERVRRELVEPVRRIPGDRDEQPTEGVALCLSGGGYRAMLFHLGIVWRLHEAGWLGRLDRVSSVSGGSITAATLALAWEDLRDGGSFEELVADRLRGLASRGVDIRSVLTGIATPGSIGEKVAAAYRRHLFDDATLQDLPDRPRFVINATNVGSGDLVRFSKPHLADWRVGRVESPRVELAAAVACSSAFPPVLSPYRLDMAGADWLTEEGNDLTEPEHRDELVLTDGGVYDNLGLETAWKGCRTVIVSDAGGRMVDDADPAGDWPRHMVRVLKVVDNQVRSLRKRQVIEGFEAGLREGVYLGIRSDIENYEAPDVLPCPQPRTLALAETATRLAPLEGPHQERLVNWGYAICDAGLRAHLDRDADPPAGFPYPEAGVG
jgi:NTE family protein